MRVNNLYKKLNNFNWLLMNFLLTFFSLEKEHGGDSSVFWSSLYINAGAWLGLFVWEIIRFQLVWAIIAFILLVFSGTNLYGYVKCSKEQQSNILKFGAKTVMKVAEKGVDVAKNQA